MSDLISRSQLLKEIETWCGCVDALHDYIQNMPTAYDVDKVVNELEKAAQYIKINGKPTRVKAIHPAQAIEIVKQGGVSDDVCEWTQSGDMAISPHTFSKYKIKQCDGLYALSTCPYCRKQIKAVE